MDRVKVYEDRLLIPTYELLEENINPRLGHSSTYPHALQDFRSYELKDKEHPVVVLENQYLKVTVMPHYGGRIYSAYDKIGRGEIFTKNPVILPRMIAHRGGWLSGGVEFNFPIGHSPHTMDLVNYTLQNYDDGSASILFGNIEQIYDMNWKVELKLYPTSAYIEQRVWLYNPHNVEHRYYFWTNAAVEYNEQVKLIYPFDWSINNYTSEYVKWPYFKDFNSAVPKEIPYSYETFGKLLRENFFSAYDMGKDRGVVHYSDRKKLKGAKFFIWGNDPRGDAWNRALTNDGSKYLEIQCGPFESQAVMKFLLPHQEISWVEYWYPVYDLQGLKHAEKELAINVIGTDTGVGLNLQATEDLGECKVILNFQGQVYKQLVVLCPGQIRTVDFDFGQPYRTGDRLIIDVYNRHKHVLSLGSKDEYTESPIDVDLYEDSRVVKDPADDHKLLNQALKAESRGGLKTAKALYEKVLEENLGCITSLKRLGLIALKRGEYQAAEEYFRKVLTYNNRDSEARFYMASVLKETGDLKFARRLYMDIAADSYWHYPSAIEAAKIDISLKYFKDAQTILENHIKDDNYGRFLLAVAYRKDGLAEPAEKVLDSAYPKDEYYLVERFFLTGLQTDLKYFLKTINEDRRILKSLAVEYIGLGLWEEAEKILDLIKGSDLKKQLLKLYIDTTTSKAEGMTIQKALEGSLDYVFVNEKVITDTLSRFSPIDTTGKADYLLGNYLCWLDKYQEALECFLAAYQKGLRYTVLLRNLGHIFLKEMHDSKRALPFLEEDVYVYKSANPDSLKMLDDIYSEQGEQEKRRVLLPYMNQVKNRSLIHVNLVNLLVDMGELDEALKIIQTEQFENWEGREISGPLYRRVIIHLAWREMERGNLEKAVAYAKSVHDYPENLNYGESVRANLSEIHYYKGLIFSRAGLEQQAREEFRKGATEIYRPEVTDKESSKKFALKCAIEAQKRY
jgi:hypothetical protein